MGPTQTDLTQFLCLNQITIPPTMAVSDQRHRISDPARIGSR
jgi:hypothetical protein